MANVNANKNKGPIINPALCRCCHSIKKCRLLTAEYEFNGSKEVYCDMFMDVFGLLLPHLDGDSMECCICATCVSRLREASDFRKQVLQSEQLFLDSRLKENDKNVTLEIKLEPTCDSDTRDGVSDSVHHSDDSEADTKMDKDAQIMNVTSTVTKKSLKRTRNGHKLLDQMSAAGKIQRLHRKMEKLLNPEPPEKPQTKKHAEPMDQNRMALINTVLIVTYSYACPFLNRISFYYCFYCKDQFTSPTELRDHTLSHDPKLFENTIEHNKIPIVDITRIDCRLCSEKIDDIETFKTHITSKHQKVLYPVANEFLKFKLTPNNLTCTECDAVFPFFDSLKKHMVEHFGTHTCDECGARFIEVSLLRSHIKKKHNKVDANYPCEICGKNLKSKYSMGLHVATVHEKKPTVNCYKCDAAFLSYALRNRHLIEAHGDQRTFPCKLCDKVYNRRKTLIEHHRRNHLKVFNHQCELCAQTFYLPSSLQEHMAVHTGERNFKCEHCDKSYPGLKSLQCHMRSHKR
ncbi:PR domain zinc finger protein 5-like [Maniola jurtina]|uniref:PR domain zinc finger protein 5-like n=1 Tax=Maniola jurtina TaxID=191418 RepID=UPI001E68BCFB|nr:PR domain zinc finger protein 5-like [Maniola jurtina]